MALDVAGRKKTYIVVCSYILQILLGVTFLSDQLRAQAAGKDILAGANLTPGFNLGVDSSARKRDWLHKDAEGYFEMSYPKDQTWGAVFLTVGPPTPKMRPSKDFSGYAKLVIDMKAGPGSDVIDIGLKTDTQPDDGTETKVSLKLSPQWQTYEVPLTNFTGTDLRKLYVVTEFVFAGPNAQTVYFRNIRYLAKPASSDPPAAVQAGDNDIMVGARLTAGFDMGVDSSEQSRNWLSKNVEEGCLSMSYPKGQTWGAVFITVGRPRNPPRPFRDFSPYQTLAIDMKGGPGADVVEIGVKTDTQPDDGSEAKIPIKLSPQWRTYEIPLRKFEGTDVRKLYVVTEFVFAGDNAQTVYFRNIRYLTRAPRPD